MSVTQSIMARLRFPGRPGCRADRVGIPFCAEDVTESVDPALSFITNIKRGNKKFKELCGESEEEDFEGFTEEDVRLSGKKLRAAARAEHKLQGPHPTSGRVTDTDHCTPPYPSHHRSSSGLASTPAAHPKSQNVRGIFGSVGGPGEMPALTKEEILRKALAAKELLASIKAKHKHALQGRVVQNKVGRPRKPWKSAAGGKVVEKTSCSSDLETAPGTSKEARSKLVATKTAEQKSGTHQTPKTRPSSKQAASSPVRQMQKSRKSRLTGMRGSDQDVKEAAAGSQTESQPVRPPTDRSKAVVKQLLQKAKQGGSRLAKVKGTEDGLGEVASQKRNAHTFVLPQFSRSRRAIIPNKRFIEDDPIPSAVLTIKRPRTESTSQPTGDEQPLENKEDESLASCSSSTPLGKTNVKTTTLPQSSVIRKIAVKCHFPLSSGSQMPSPSHKRFSKSSPLARSPRTSKKLPKAKSALSLAASVKTGRKDGRCSSVEEPVPLSLKTEPASSPAMTETSKKPPKAARKTDAASKCGRTEGSPRACRTEGTPKACRADATPNGNRLEPTPEGNGTEKTEASQTPRLSMRTERNAAANRSLSQIDVTPSSTCDSGREEQMSPVAVPTAEQLVQLEMSPVVAVTPHKMNPADTTPSSSDLLLTAHTSSSSSFRKGLLEQPLIVEGKRQRVPSLKVRLINWQSEESAALSESEGSELAGVGGEGEVRQNGSKKEKFTLFPKASSTAPKKFSRAGPMKLQRRDKDGKESMLTKRSGQIMLRKAKLQLNRTALNRSKAALARSLKAQLKREAKQRGKKSEPQRHSPRPGVTSPLSISVLGSGGASHPFDSPNSQPSPLLAGLSPGSQGGFASPPRIVSSLSPISLPSKKEPEECTPQKSRQSTKLDCRGPRIKHVCRRAAVVLPKPLATFPAPPDPSESPTLSALPSPEKERLLQSHTALSEDDRDSSEDEKVKIKKRKIMNAKLKKLRREAKLGRFRGKRKNRCKECRGCLAPNCGKCVYCLDSKKFGGKNILKQACVNRKCERPVYSKQATDAFIQPKNNKGGGGGGGGGAGRKVEGDEVDSSQVRQGPSRMARPSAGFFTTMGGDSQGGDIHEDEGELCPGEGRSPPSSSSMRELSVRAAPPLLRMDGGERGVMMEEGGLEIMSAVGVQRHTLMTHARRLLKRKEKTGLRVRLPIVVPEPQPTLASLDFWSPAPGVHSVVHTELKENFDLDVAWSRGLALTLAAATCVRTVCFLCGSAGRHKLLYCSICCEPFHWFCLEEEDRPLEGCSVDNWCCRRCQFCHVCGLQTGLLQCDRCQDTYHPECLGPAYPKQPSRRNVWVCTKCVRCKSCGATTPGSSTNATWTYDFSLCFHCGKLMDKGNFCPVCRKCYTDDDWESKMVQCSLCDSWVHSKCEGLTDEMYQLFAYLPEDIQYRCRVCCPEDPPEWRTILREELLTGLKSVLLGLTSFKCTHHLMMIDEGREKERNQRAQQRKKPLPGPANAADVHRTSPRLSSPESQRTSPRLPRPTRSNQSSSPEENQTFDVITETETGVTCLNPEAGVTYLNAEAGVSHLNAEAGVTRLNAEAGVSRLNAEAGVSHLNAETGISHTQQTASSQGEPSANGYFLDNPPEKEESMEGIEESDSGRLSPVRSDSRTTTTTPTTSLQHCSNGSGCKGENPAESANASAKSIVYQQPSESKQGGGGSSTSDQLDSSSVEIKPDVEFYSEERAWHEDGLKKEIDAEFSAEFSSSEVKAGKTPEGANFLRNESSSTLTASKSSMMTSSLPCVTMETADGERSAALSTEAGGGEERVSRGVVRNLFDSFLASSGVRGSRDEDGDPFSDRTEGRREASSSEWEEKDVKIEDLKATTPSSCQSRTTAEAMDHHSNPTTTTTPPPTRMTSLSDSHHPPPTTEQAHGVISQNASCRNVGTESVYLSDTEEDPVRVKTDKEDWEAAAGNTTGGGGEGGGSSCGMLDFSQTPTGPPNRGDDSGARRRGGEHHVTFTVNMVTGAADSRAVVVPHFGRQFPRDFRAVRMKLEADKYTSVEAFNEDMVHIIQTALSDDHLLPTRRKLNNSVKSIFIKQMERVFPWFNVKNCQLWQHIRVLPQGMLPEAVVPPNNDHTYAQWLERESTLSVPQLSLFKPLPLMPAHSVQSTESSELCEDMRQCSLCLEMGDSYPNDAGRLLYAGQDDWVHVNCALWSAEVFEEEDGTLQNVHVSMVRGRQLRCNRCQMQGATVGCCVQGCPANYHFLCARRQLCLFKEDKTVYCYEHREQANCYIENQKGFAVHRRVCVDMADIRCMKKSWARGLDSGQVNILFGCCTVESMGCLAPLSDCKGCLLPLDFRCTRVYWSTVDARRRTVYTCRIVEVRPTPQTLEAVLRDVRVVHDESHPEYVPLDTLDLPSLGLAHLLSPSDDVMCVSHASPGRSVCERQSSEMFGAVESLEHTDQTDTRTDSEASIENISVATESGTFSVNDHFPSSHHESTSAQSTSLEMLPGDGRLLPAAAPPPPPPRSCPVVDSSRLPPPPPCPVVDYSRLSLKTLKLLNINISDPRMTASLPQPDRSLLLPPPPTPPSSSSSSSTSSPLPDFGNLTGMVQRLNRAAMRSKSGDAQSSGRCSSEDRAATGLPPASGGRQQRSASLSPLGFASPVSSRLQSPPPVAVTPRSARCRSLSPSDMGRSLLQCRKSPSVTPILEQLETELPEKEGRENVSLAPSARQKRGSSLPPGGELFVDLTVEDSDNDSSPAAGNKHASTNSRGGHRFEKSGFQKSGAGEKISGNETQTGTCEDVIELASEGEEGVEMDGDVVLARQVLQNVPKEILESSEVKVLVVPEDVSEEEALELAQQALQHSQQQQGEDGTSPPPPLPITDADPSECGSPRHLVGEDTNRTKTLGSDYTAEKSDPAAAAAAESSRNLFRGNSSSSSNSNLPRALSGVGLLKKKADSGLDSRDPAFEKPHENDSQVSSQELGCSHTLTQAVEEETSNNALKNQETSEHQGPSSQNLGTVVERPSCSSSTDQSQSSCPTPAVGQGKDACITSSLKMADSLEVALVYDRKGNLIGQRKHRPYVVETVKQKGDFLNIGIQRAVERGITGAGKIQVSVNVSVPRETSAGTEDDQGDTTLTTHVQGDVTLTQDDDDPQACGSTRASDRAMEDGDGAGKKGELSPLEDGDRAGKKKEEESPPLKDGDYGPGKKEEELSDVTHQGDCGVEEKVRAAEKSDKLVPEDSAASLESGRNKLSAEQKQVLEKEDTLIDHGNSHRNSAQRDGTASGSTSMTTRLASSSKTVGALNVESSTISPGIKLPDDIIDSKKLLCSVSVHKLCLNDASSSVSVADVCKHGCVSKCSVKDCSRGGESAPPVPQGSAERDQEEDRESLCGVDVSAVESGTKSDISIPESGTKSDLGSGTKSERSVPESGTKSDSSAVESVSESNLSVREISATQDARRDPVEQKTGGGRSVSAAAAVSVKDLEENLLLQADASSRLWHKLGLTCLPAASSSSSSSSCLESISSGKRLCNGAVDKEGSPPTPPPPPPPLCSKDLLAMALNPPSSVTLPVPEALRTVECRVSLERLTTAGPRSCDVAGNSLPPHGSSHGDDSFPLSSQRPSSADSSKGGGGGGGRVGVMTGVEQNRAGGGGGGGGSGVAAAAASTPRSLKVADSCPSFSQSFVDFLGKLKSADQSMPRDEAQESNPIVIKEERDSASAESGEGSVSRAERDNGIIQALTDPEMSPLHTESDSGRVDGDSLPLHTELALRIKAESLARSSPGESGPFKCPTCKRLYRTLHSFSAHAQSCDFDLSTSDEEEDGDDDRRDGVEGRREDGRQKLRTSLRQSTLTQRKAMESSQQQLAQQAAEKTTTVTSSAKGGKPDKPPSTPDKSPSEDSSPPRTRGRLKRPSGNDVRDALSSSDHTPEPVRRGRGRPRKMSGQTPKAENLSVEEKPVEQLSPKESLLGAVGLVSKNCLDFQSGSSDSSACVSASQDECSSQQKTLSLRQSQSRQSQEEGGLEELVLSNDDLVDPAVSLLRVSSQQGEQDASESPVSQGGLSASQDTDVSPVSQGGMSTSQDTDVSPVSQGGMSTSQDTDVSPVSQGGMSTSQDTDVSVPACQDQAVGNVAETFCDQQQEGGEADFELSHSEHHENTSLPVSSEPCAQRKMSEEWEDSDHDSDVIIIGEDTVGDPSTGGQSVSRPNSVSEPESVTRSVFVKLSSDGQTPHQSATHDKDGTTTKDANLVCRQRNGSETKVQSLTTGGGVSEKHRVASPILSRLISALSSSSSSSSSFSAAAETSVCSKVVGKMEQSPWHVSDTDRTQPSQDRLITETVRAGGAERFVVDSASGSAGMRPLHINVGHQAEALRTAPNTGVDQTRGRPASIPPTHHAAKTPAVSSIWAPSSLHQPGSGAVTAAAPSPFSASAAASSQGYSSQPLSTGAASSCQDYSSRSSLLLSSTNVHADIDSDDLSFTDSEDEEEDDRIDDAESPPLSVTAEPRKNTTVVMSNVAMLKGPQSIVPGSQPAASPYSMVVMTSASVSGGGMTTPGILSSRPAVASNSAVMCVSSTAAAAPTPTPILQAPNPIPTPTPTPTPIPPGPNVHQTPASHLLSMLDKLSTDQKVILTRQLVQKGTLSIEAPMMPHPPLTALGPSGDPGGHRRFGVGTVQPTLLHGGPHQLRIVNTPSGMNAAGPLTFIHHQQQPQQQQQQQRENSVVMRAATVTSAALVTQPTPQGSMQIFQHRPGIVMQHPVLPVASLPTFAPSPGRMTSPLLPPTLPVSSPSNLGAAAAGLLSVQGQVPGTTARMLSAQGQAQAPSAAAAAVLQSQGQSQPAQVLCQPVLNHHHPLSHQTLVPSPIPGVGYMGTFLLDASKGGGGGGGVVGTDKKGRLQLVSLIQGAMASSCQASSVHSTVASFVNAGGVSCHVSGVGGQGQGQGQSSLRGLVSPAAPRVIRVVVDKSVHSEHHALSHALSAAVTSSPSSQSVVRIMHVTPSHVSCTPTPAISPSPAPSPFHPALFQPSSPFIPSAHHHPPPPPPPSFAQQDSVGRTQIWEAASSPLPPASENLTFAHKRQAYSLPRPSLPPAKRPKVVLERNGLVQVKDSAQLLESEGRTSGGAGSCEGMVQSSSSSCSSSAGCQTLFKVGATIAQDSSSKTASTSNYKNLLKNKITSRARKSNLAVACKDSPAVTQAGTFAVPRKVKAKARGKVKARRKVKAKADNVPVKKRVTKRKGGPLSHPIVHLSHQAGAVLPQAEVEEEIRDTPLRLNPIAPPSQGPTEGRGAWPKDLPRLAFEINSEDGFSCRADTMEEAWCRVTEKVQDARAAARMKQMSYGGVNGVQMFGVGHDAVVYLVEQLAGAANCRQYKFRYQQYEPPEDEELLLNPSGSARCSPFMGRKPYDIFSFLMSRHRHRPTLKDNTSKEEEMEHKSSRRATSMELPMAMRFRKLQEHAKEAVGVYRSKIHGRGLFCKRNIDNGEMVIEYSGEIIRSSLTDKREKYYESKGIGCYMFRIDDFEVVDATMHGSAARFINHSCESNCYSKVINVDGKKHIVIFASRAIKKGEELTYDYKFPIEDVKIPCTCGSRRCRKYLN